jgi:hypothetical protein
LQYWTFWLDMEKSGKKTNEQANLTLNIFYCSKRQKDKTQVKQLRQSSPITYISKYAIEHNDI